MKTDGNSQLNQQQSKAQLSQPLPQKYWMTLLKDNLLISIAIAGMFLALIIVLKHSFSFWKVFGGYSIQMFLVVYFVGLYIIKNKVVSVAFLVTTPAILLLVKPPSTIISPMQIFVEYFVAFLIFGLTYLVLPLTKYLKQRILSPKWSKVAEVSTLTLCYFVILVLKFLVHWVAGFLYWDQKVWDSFTFNLTASLANNALTIPVFALICPVVLGCNTKLSENLALKY